MTTFTHVHLSHLEVSRRVNRAAGGVLPAPVFEQVFNADRLVERKHLAYGGPWRAALFSLCGGLSKLYFYGLNNFEVVGADKLHHWVESGRAGRGLLTVANHLSFIDDNAIAAVCKAGWYARANAYMRWTLAAEDVCFTNPVLNAFFRLLKALPIRRGGGLDHPYVGEARALLRRGHWVHMYPEGRISTTAELLRFRRGLSRLARVEENPPLVVPIALAGIGAAISVDQWLPRVGCDITVMVGDPVPTADIVAACAAGRIAPDDADQMLTERIRSAVAELKAKADAHHARRFALSTRDPPSSQAGAPSQGGASSGTS